MAKRQRRRRQRRRREHAKRDGWQTRHSVITGVAVTAGGMLGTVQPALADNFTVNAGGDAGDGICQDVVSGDCTLRDAVYSANDNSNYSYIRFASAVTGTITLDGPIGIIYGTYIYGPGPGTLTISGGNNNGIFNAFMDFSGDPLYIGGLTLRDGSQIVGGAIYNGNANLSVNNAVLTGNDALAGGAIYDAGGFAGGYYSDLTFSTLTGNEASYGGALFAGTYFGLIGATTFQGNQATYGGAIDAPGSPVVTFNSQLFDSTVSGNSSYFGGGIFAYAAEANNTIVGANSNFPGGVYRDVLSAYFYGYFGLIGNPDGTLVHGNSNITGVDPQLSALANNGGSTPTMKPAAGSPVVDKGDSGAPVDQRFFTRPVDNPLVPNATGGDASDIGSVELTLGEGPQPPAAQPPAPVVKKKKCKKKKKKRSAELAKKKKCKKKKKRSAKAAADRAISAWRAEARSGSSPRSGPPEPRAHQRSDRAGWADQAWRLSH